MIFWWYIFWWDQQATLIYILLGLKRSTFPFREIMFSWYSVCSGHHSITWVYTWILWVTMGMSNIDWSAWLSFDWSWTGLICIQIQGLSTLLSCKSKSRLRFSIWLFSNLWLENGNYFAAQTPSSVFVMLQPDQIKLFEIGLI